MVEACGKLLNTNIHHADVVQMTTTTMVNDMSYVNVTCADVSMQLQKLQKLLHLASNTCVCFAKEKIRDTDMYIMKQKL
jgi:hypothetical protein